MTKLVLTFGAVIASVTIVNAQGTIWFENGILTRVRICTDDSGVNTHAPPGVQVIVGVWYGPSADVLIQAPGTASASSSSGIMADASSAYALPGTAPGQTVALQIRGWNEMGWYGETKVAQVTLGPTEGPGTTIWQTASGVNPDRFTPLIVECPEPASIALAVLAVVLGIGRVRQRNGDQTRYRNLKSRNSRASV